MCNSCLSLFVVSFDTCVFVRWGCVFLVCWLWSFVDIRCSLVCCVRSVVCLLALRVVLVFVSLFVVRWLSCIVYCRLRTVVVCYVLFVDCCRLCLVIVVCLFVVCRSVCAVCCCLLLCVVDC